VRRAFEPLPSSRTTSKERFGRSKPERTWSGSRIWKRAAISRATASVAVAVQAITVGRPSRSAISGSRR
jgi:anti-sigma-K factor RskA